MRPVAQRTQPARTAHADRHGLACAGDLGTLRVDQVRRATHEGWTARIVPHPDDRRVANDSASANPCHGARLGEERR